MSAGPLPDAGTHLVLPAHQTYTDGTVVDWVDVAEEGGEEPAHPAPELTTTGGRRAVRRRASSTRPPPSPRRPRRRPSPTPSPACSAAVGLALGRRRARAGPARPPSPGRRMSRAPRAGALGLLLGLAAVVLGGARGAGAQRPAEHRPGGGLDRPGRPGAWSRSPSTSPCCSSAPRSWCTRPTRRWSTSARRSSSTTPPAIAVTGELPAGEYTVIYRVTSADGHPIEGQFRFTAAEATSYGVATAAPTMTPSPTTSAEVQASESATPEPVAVRPPLRPAEEGASPGPSSSGSSRRSWWSAASSRGCC